MQTSLVAVLLLVSSAWSFNNALLDNMETTTVSDLDNMVESRENSYQSRNYDSFEASTPAAQPMPIHGCFSNVENVDQTSNTATSESQNLPEQNTFSDPVPPVPTSRDRVAAPWYQQPSPNFYHMRRQLPFRSYSGPYAPSYQRFGYPYSGPYAPFHRQFGYPISGPYASNYQRFGYPYSGPYSPSFQRFGNPHVGPYSPFHKRFGFPHHQEEERHMPVVVKLLQPIILPIAKPYHEYPSINPDVENEIEGEKFTSRGFNQGHHRFGAGRFGGERLKRFGTPYPMRQNTFGPYGIGENGDNLHITLKLH